VTAEETQRTPFGKLLRTLRLGVHERQENFADRLGVSRSLIASLETKSSPSEEFVAILTEAFPAHEAAILQALQQTGHVSRPRRQRVSPLEKAVHIAMHLGKFDVAAQLIADQFLHEDPPPAEACWLYHQLGRVLRIEERYPAATDALFRAVRLGEKLWFADEIAEDKVIDIWADFLSLLLERDTKWAEYHVDDSLSLHPTAGILWHTKGVAHWAKRELANAYAAFTFSMQYSELKEAPRYARAFVLAEWGRWHEAIDELQSMSRRSEPDREARAVLRTVLGATFMHVGEADAALAELDKAEQLAPGHAGIAYNRGLCLVALKETEQAIGEFKRSLEAEDPRLNEDVRRDVEELVASLETGAPYVPLDLRRRLDYEHWIQTRDRDDTSLAPITPVRQRDDGAAGSTTKTARRGAQAVPRKR
jgi:transcriptional regulator with XRE-family HTH domain